MKQLFWNCLLNNLTAINISNIFKAEVLNLSVIECVYSVMFNEILFF